MLAPRACEQRLDRNAANRRVDELDRMERRNRLPGAPQRCRHLDEAARVAARIRVGARRADVPGLAVAELRRRARLDEVVDPGAAAARVLLGGLEALEACDRVEHRTRRARDAL